MWPPFKPHLLFSAEVWDFLVKLWQSIYSDRSPQCLAQRNSGAELYRAFLTLVSVYIAHLRDRNFSAETFRLHPYPSYHAAVERPPLRGWHKTSFWNYWIETTLLKGFQRWWSCCVEHIVNNVLISAFHEFSYGFPHCVSIENYIHLKFLQHCLTTNIKIDCCCFCNFPEAIAVEKVFSKLIKVL